MAKRKRKLPNSLIVTQSNQLVEARYNLPLAEQRLILTMISKIQPSDEDFQPYRINVNELADFLGIDKNSAYRECKRITENLLKRVVSIDETDGLLQIGWVSSAKYIDGSGVVNLSFDPKLKPYLLQLKGNFTSSKLEMLLSFKSQYTVRMYTLLKQYEKLKEREIELDLLRGILGIGKEQYLEYKNFKNRVLYPTQRELTEKADLYFEFDEIKYGRKVGAIRFRIFIRKPLNSTLGNAIDNQLLITQITGQPEADMVIPLASLVLEQHKTKKTVHTALEIYEKKYGYDYVKRNILYSNEKAEKSYAGFLSKALKEDWAHDWELQQQEIVEKKKIKEVWERNGFKSKKDYDDFMYRKQMKIYEKKVS